MAEGSLDYRTLFLVSGIVGTALLLLLAMQARKPYPGFVRVLLALSVVSAAVIIADLRGFAPDALLSIQLTALVGFAAIDSGVRRFSGAPRRGRWPYLLRPAPTSTNYLDLVAIDSHLCGYCIASARQST